MYQSRLVDDKDIFKSREKEKMFNKRYGKQVNITVSYDINTSEFKSMDDLKEYTLKFRTLKGKEYTLTEILDKGATKKVVLKYNNQGKEIKSIFLRFIDAEVTLADYIAEE